MLILVKNNYLIGKVVYHYAKWRRIRIFGRSLTINKAARALISSIAIVFAVIDSFIPNLPRIRIPFITRGWGQKMIVLAFRRAAVS